MQKWRIIRTHVETYVADIDAETKEDALRIAEENPEDFEPVESSAYEYDVIPFDNLRR